MFSIFCADFILVHRASGTWDWTRTADPRQTRPGSDLQEEKRAGEGEPSFASRAAAMPWTAEQKREGRRQKALREGRASQIKWQRGKTAEPPKPIWTEAEAAPSNPRTLQEDFEAARMANEDLRQRLMDIGTRVDAARLADIRRRMVPGTKVRIKPEWHLPLSAPGQNPRENGHRMVLKQRVDDKWMAQCLTGPNKGCMFWCTLPESAFDFA